MLQLPDGMSKVLTLEKAYQTVERALGPGLGPNARRCALCCADPGSAPGPELSSMPVLLDEREAGAASRALDATSQPPPGALSPECSAGSDFAARRATLKPLPKQDSGVPEAMATKGTEELPQFHENAGPQSSASELSPDTVCRAPPNGVDLQRLCGSRRSVARRSREATAGPSSSRGEATSSVSDVGKPAIRAREGLAEPLRG